MISTALLNWASDMVVKMKTCDCSLRFEFPFLGKSFGIFLAAFLKVLWLLTLRMDEL